MEREKNEGKSRDETGFSEKQLDVNVETGTFKKRGFKKIVFEKKRKK